MTPRSLPLALVASRLGLEPGEFTPLGRGRAAVDPSALGGRAQGRWILHADGARGGRSPEAGAVALAEAFEEGGARALASLTAPSLAGALSGDAPESLVLDLAARLVPEPSAHAVRDAFELASAVGRHEELVVAPGLADELADLVASTSDERTLAAAIARVVLGRRADGRERALGDTPAVPALVALLADALRPTLAVSRGGTAALLSSGALGVPGVAATRVALRAADVVVASVGGCGAAGVRRALELVAPRTGARPTAVVLATDLPGLRFESGVGARVRPSELARVLEADDPELAERGFARFVARARTVAGWRVPVVCAFAARTRAERDELGTFAARAEELGLTAAVHDADRTPLLEALDALPADAARAWRPYDRTARDLATAAHDAAVAAGFQGILDVHPEPARLLLAWGHEARDGLDVLLEPPTPGEAWTVVEARLERGARLVRLRTATAARAEHGPPSWSTVVFDAHGRPALRRR